MEARISKRTLAPIIATLWLQTVVIVFIVTELYYTIRTPPSEWVKKALLLLGV
jgi:hypothetical protein